MNKTLKKLIVLIEIIVSITLGYISITVSFPTLLINLIISIIALFFFMQVLGNVDEINGYNAGIPDNNHLTGILDDNDENNSGNPD